MMHRQEPTAPAADADGSAAADGAAESKPKRPKTSVKDTRHVCQY
jgi:hypothetical protein